MSLPTNRQDGDVIENEDINAMASAINDHEDRLTSIESDSGTSGTVTSVNGVEPDESGNVTIEAGGASIKVGGSAPASGWWLDNGYVQPGIPVTATGPTWTDDAVNGGGTWTTPTQTGITYSPASGTANPGQTVIVTATEWPGYVLQGASSWSHVFPAVPSILGPWNIPSGGFTVGAADELILASNVGDGQLAWRTTPGLDGISIRAQVWSYRGELGSSTVMPAVVFRYIDANNFFYYSLRSGSPDGAPATNSRANLYRVTGGTHTMLGEWWPSPSLDPNDKRTLFTARVDIAGDTFTCFDRDGTTVLGTRTDTAHSVSPNVGLRKGGTGNPLTGLPAPNDFGLPWSLDAVYL